MFFHAFVNTFPASLTRFDRIVARKRYCERDAAHVLRQVCEAIKCLHDNQVAHCDLKPDNLLFKDDSDDGIKIIDFNLAKFVAPLLYMTRREGTMYYMAPEVLSSKYSIHCDMWSFGVIMYVHQSFSLSLSLSLACPSMITLIIFMTLGM